MSLDLTDSLKALLIETAAVLKGAERRQFMAKTVNELGRGGQSRAERELGWNRGLIRKGRHELESGVTCLDGFKQRGRKRIESRLPNLLESYKYFWCTDPEKRKGVPFWTEKKTRAGIHHD